MLYSNKAQDQYFAFENCPLCGAMFCLGRAIFRIASVRRNSAYRGFLYRDRSCVPGIYQWDWERNKSHEEQIILELL